VSARFQPKQKEPEAQAIDGLYALIEQVVEQRVRPLEDALEQMKNGKEQVKQAEEYLDVPALAERIHKPEKTIRDWLRKRKTNGIPVVKMPVGGLIFPWSKFEAWLLGKES
jgi:hypothetical protein